MGLQIGMYEIQVGTPAQEQGTVEHQLAALLWFRRHRCYLAEEDTVGHTVESPPGL